MGSLSENAKLIIIIIVMIVVAGFLAFFLYSGSEREKQIQEEIEATQTAITKLERDKIAKIPQLRRELIEARPRWELFMKVLPDEKPSIDEKIGLLKMQSGFDIQDYSAVEEELPRGTSTTKKTGPLHHYYVVIKKGQGSYFNFIKLLNLLENNPYDKRLYRVDGFTLSAARDSDMVEVKDLKISFFTYTDEEIAKYAFKLQGLEEDQPDQPQPREGETDAVTPVSN